MTAPDTNVLVRLIARDDPAQVASAAALVRAEPCWISLTVLLEMERVLRAAYAFERDDILQAFEHLVSMRNITIERAAIVRQALSWYRGGLDFANALHLACAREHARFASFDAALRKHSDRLRTRSAVFSP